jgi:hypothetical protein
LMLALLGKKTDTEKKTDIKAFDARTSGQKKQTLIGCRHTQQRDTQKRRGQSPWRETKRGRQTQRQKHADRHGDKERDQKTRADIYGVLTSETHTRRHRRCINFETHTGRHRECINFENR